jgi:predicted transcriptional regulator
MLKELDCVAELTNQKVSALMKQLVEDGSVVKTEDKRKSYFTKG